MVAGQQWGAEKSLRLAAGDEMEREARRRCDDIELGSAADPTPRGRLAPLWLSSVVRQKRGAFIGFLADGYGEFVKGLLVHFGLDARFLVLDKRINLGRC